MNGEYEKVVFFLSKTNFPAVHSLTVFDNCTDRDADDDDDDGGGEKVNDDDGNNDDDDADVIKKSKICSFYHFPNIKIGFLPFLPLGVVQK